MYAAGPGYYTFQRYCLAGKSCVGVAYCGSAFCEELFFVFVKIKLDDFLDTVLTEDTGYADAEIFLAIFAFEKRRAGNHAFLVVYDSLYHFGCGSSGSIPCACAEQFGECRTAYHCVGNYLVESFVRKQVCSRHTAESGKAFHRYHGGIAVTADYKAFNLVGVGLESLAEVIFEAA